MEWNSCDDVDSVRMMVADSVTFSSSHFYSGVLLDFVHWSMAHAWMIWHFPTLLLSREQSQKSLCVFHLAFVRAASSTFSTHKIAYIDCVHIHYTIYTAYGHAAILLASTLWCHIILHNNIFTFFSVRSFGGTEKMDFFFIWNLLFIACLNIHSFNLVNVLAPNVSVRVRLCTYAHAHREGECLQTLDSLKVPNHRPKTESRRKRKRARGRKTEETRWRRRKRRAEWEMTENIYSPKLTKLLAFWCHWMARMPMLASQSLHILLNHFDDDICFRVKRLYTSR